ncbi:hypothetical protein IC232_29830 [Microvirga sp. BT688]|uniref:DUF6894 family protein n=1 Tax=Microvirga sp. TaxID=1873136 RepID=UPI001689742B|nr:hypothetical protein [Microvirga sp.]MBD2750844.1 hypothetical protein [Microvirga sp.]
MHYHFYISDGERVYIDNIGVDLPSSSAAVDRARATAYQLMHELSSEVRDWTKWRFQVVGEEQGDCFILPFSYIQQRAKLLHGSLPLNNEAPTGLGQKFWC